MDVTFSTLLKQQNGLKINQTQDVWGSNATAGGDAATG
jgi:hypothetical protein